MYTDYSRLFSASGGAADYSKLLGAAAVAGGNDYTKLLAAGGAGGAAAAAMGGANGPGDYSKLLGGGYNPFMQAGAYMNHPQLGMGQPQIPGIVPTSY